MRIAYALRAEYRDTYLGGVLAVGTSSLDVKAELEDNDGLILVSEHEHLTLAVLDTYPPLERVGDRPDAHLAEQATSQPPEVVVSDVPTDIPALLAGEPDASASSDASTSTRPARESSTSTPKER